MSRFLSLFLLLTLSLFAAEPKKYLGIGLGIGSGYQEWAYNEQHNYFLGSTYDDLYWYDFDATVKEVKLGFDYETFRLEISSISIDLDIKDKENKRLSGIDIDYILPFFKDNDSLFPFFAIGIGSYSNAFAFNMNFGLSFAVTDTIQMELAYKLKSIQGRTIKTSQGDNLDISNQVYYGYFGLKFML